jgi:2-polyprenyl-3-methyl-5-hydroxy-6-metoxy-1,4-benzoquinol methylase
MEDYIYQKCTECGLIYQNPRPIFKELKKRYTRNYFNYEHSNQDNFFNLMKLGLRDIRFDRLYAGDNGGKKFLDIGCATGLLLNHMKDKGWNTTGVEICKPSAEYARKKFGLNVFIGTLEEAQFPDNYFDVIHFSHLIEHVPDPRVLLLEVKRILKEDGHVILTTPNIDGFQARLSRQEWRSAIPDHIYLFAKKTMKKLLSDIHFHIIKQISWGGIPVGKRSKFLKYPADKLAKFFNVGDVMLFHCVPLAPKNRG